MGPSQYCGYSVISLISRIKNITPYKYPIELGPFTFYVFSKTLINIIIFVYLVALKKEIMSKLYLSVTVRIKIN